MTRSSDQTAMGGYERHFPETEWTRMHNPIQREAILAELCERYWKPLYAYLCCKGFQNEQAKDLVQGFFTDKVLGQEFVTSADRNRGRFRNFLLVALRNYTINVQKKDKGQGNQSIENLSLDPADDQGPETEFDRAWAEALLAESLETLKSEYLRKDRQVYWELFREWLLERDESADSASMDDLCVKYQIPNPNQAYKIIFRTKARFREVLRTKLQSQVATEEEVDIEIARFIEIFSQH
ncbi:hypothetical protein ACFL3F_02050 [Planctomycetota bacterium]